MRKKIRRKDGKAVVCQLQGLERRVGLEGIRRQLSDVVCADEQLCKIRKFVAQPGEPIAVAQICIESSPQAKAFEALKSGPIPARKAIQLIPRKVSACMWCVFVPIYMKVLRGKKGRKEGRKEGGRKEGRKEGRHRLVNL
jgi:hypothetical protein